MLHGWIKSHLKHIYCISILWSLFLKLSLIKMKVLITELQKTMFRAKNLFLCSRQTHTRLGIYVVSINSVQYQHYIMLRRLQWSSPVLLKWRKLRRAGGAWWGAGVWSCVSTCSVGGQVLSASHQGRDHKPGQTQWKEKRKGKHKN